MSCLTPLVFDSTKHLGSHLSTLEDDSLLSTISDINSSAMKQAVIVDYWRQIAGYEDRQPAEVLRGSRRVHPAAKNRHAFSVEDVEAFISDVTKVRMC